MTNLKAFQIERLIHLRDNATKYGCLPRQMDGTLAKLGLVTASKSATVITKHGIEFLKDEDF